MKKFSVLGVFVAFAFALMAAPASAGVYVGGVIGQSSMKSAGLTDNADTAYGVYGGYKLTDTAAIELAYVDTGRVAAGAASTRGDALAATLTNDYVVAHNVELYAKAGVATTTLRTAVAKANRTGLTYGFGLKYDYAKDVGLRFGFDRYNYGDTVTGLTHGHTWTGGAEYRF